MHSVLEGQRGGGGGGGGVGAAMHVLEAHNLQAWFLIPCKCVAFISVLELRKVTAPESHMSQQALADSCEIQALADSQYLAVQTYSYGLCLFAVTFSGAALCCSLEPNCAFVTV